MTGGARIAIVAAIGSLAIPASAGAVVRTDSSYRGFNPWSSAADRCDARQPLRIFEPDGPGPFPVLLYHHGTLGDWSGALDGAYAAREAAAHGFVGVSVHYDSWVTLNAEGIRAHARCIYDRARPAGAASTVCARPKADCARGLFSAGHSQGGLIATVARNVNASVRATYALGVNGPDIPDVRDAPDGTRALPDARLRVVVGQEDVASTGMGALKTMTGRDCGTGFACIDPGGGGYHVIAHSEVSDRRADHCAMWSGCFAFTPDPAWAPPSPAAWGLTSAFMWMRGLAVG